MKPLKKLPIIFSDVNGVLIRGLGPIPGSDRALSFIRQPLKDIIPDFEYHNPEFQLPFVVISNAGGKVEGRKADQYNTVMQLTGKKRLKAENMVLNFSPLRPMIQDLVHKRVLITGIGSVKDVAEDCGLSYYMTVDEYCQVFPEIFPASRRHWDDRLEVIEELASRSAHFNKAMFNDPFGFDAVLLLNDCVQWEENIQILCDILCTEDGTIPQVHPKEAPNSHIPVYCVNQDVEYSDGFRLPRLAFGAFVRSFQGVYKYKYGKEAKITFSGKPQQITFEYAKTVGEKLYEGPISNCYMIGDNPGGDIAGANKMGWETILVRTGVFTGKDNDEKYPAKHVVNDFESAIKLICEREGIKYQI